MTSPKTFVLIDEVFTHNDGPKKGQLGYSRVTTRPTVDDAREFVANIRKQESERADIRAFVGLPSLRNTYRLRTVQVLSEETI